MRLRHADTGAYLSSHDMKFQRPIPGQSEVFAAKAKNANTLWRADGLLHADNTDVQGFVDSLDASAPGWADAGAAGVSWRKGHWAPRLQFP